MNAALLLAELQARGATVTLAGDGLDIEAPPQVLTPKVLAAIKKQKPALLQVLAGRCKRVALPAASPAMREGITPKSYARASRLLRRLRASGVVFRVACEAGAIQFDEPRLLMEWQKIDSADWRKVMELRAELQHLVAGPSPGVREFDASAAYREATEEESRAP